VRSTPTKVIFTKFPRLDALYSTPTKTKFCTFTPDPSNFISLAKYDLSSLSFDVLWDPTPTKTKFCTSDFKVSAHFPKSSMVSIISLLVDGFSPSIYCRSRKFIGIHSGLRSLDLLFPVAQGQRELVIGDRQTGKTSVIVSAAVAQLMRNG